MSLGPKTWNATITAIQGDAVTLDVRAKWTNYHDGGGLWLPIDARFSAASGGRFEHIASTWSIEAPALATGRIRLYADNDYDPHAKLYRTLTSVPALELDHPDASPVEAVYDDARPHEVIYPDALGDGCDLLLRMWHARGVRAEHLIRIRKMPTEGHDAIITERIYTPLRIPGWTGAPTEIGGSGVALVVLGDPTLGMRMQPACAWYYDQAGELITTPVSVVVERRVGAGYVMLTKTIPRQFIADALAAGAYVLADETTSTYHPDANTETTTVDGNVSRVFGFGSDYNTIRTGAGTAANDSSSVSDVFGLATNVSASYTRNRRGIVLFDLTSLTGVTVSAATLSLYPFLIDTSGASWTARVCGATPASNTALVAADYGRTDTTAVDAGGLASGSWSTSNYGDVSLLTSAITLGAINKFSVKTEGDRSGTPEITTASKSIGMLIYYAEQSGASKDPKLSVTYTSGGGSTGAGNLLLLGVGA